MQTEPSILDEYMQALEAYLSGRGEGALLRAYEIGRQAVAESRGILTVVSVHHEALDELLITESGPERKRTVLRMADEFLRQALSPFELAHEGFREATETSSAIVQFTGTLCHEIRTPLTSVLASAGMLQEMCEDRLDEQERKLLANVLDGGNRIKHRTDELMDLVGLQSGSMALDRQPIDCRAFLTGVLQRIEPVAQAAGLDLEVRLPERMSETFTLDPERVEQVISNLVHNAIKFGAGGRRIEVRVAGEGGLTVEVHDHGRGIPAETQASLFRPFYRAGHRGQHVPGLGLGLTLCKEIVEAHGGRIWLTSEEGKGTVVGFMVPNYAPAHV